MATIKTVKPAGGGDYSTLASWNTAAAAVTEVSGDVYHAECYSGGSLGAMNMGTWLIVPTSSKYPRIYAASGHRHTLTTPDSSVNAGSYVSAGSTASVMQTITVSYTRFEGLSLVATNTTAISPQFITMNGGNASNVLIDGVLILLDGTAASATASNFIFVRGGTTGFAVSAEIRNTTCVANASSGTLTNACLASATTGATAAATWYNCVMLNAGASVTTTGFRNSTNATTTTTNCIACGASGNNFNGTQTQTTNISSDTTAVGTGLDSIAASSIFTDPLANWTTIAGSPNLDAGTSLAGTFTNDALGNSRPLGAAWDIGSYERASGNPWYYNQLLRAG